MSADRVVGTAILIPSSHAKELGYIHFVAMRSTGECFNNDVPIVEEANYAAVKASCDNRPLWSYRIDGDVLHCRPSVNDLGKQWHNSFDWSVKFRLYDEATDCPISAALKKLNPEFFQ